MNMMMPPKTLRFVLIVITTVCLHLLDVDVQTIATVLQVLDAAPV